LGCSMVKFIPESGVEGQKTPDIQGILGATKVLCEVKTINISEIDAKSRTTSNVNADAQPEYIVREVQDALLDNFFNKLTCSLKDAMCQMDSYCQDAAARKIAYVVLNFDNNLNEYLKNYLGQIQSHCVDSRFPKIEIVFDIKPEFYNSTVESSAQHLFVCSADGCWEGESAA
jgi:hypothetical protein